ncbi:hypothetical protein DBV15_12020 [Temnothorax longispinosus]|uniref:Uncharacterized protein n=1 Tax=Temnothorax longispinosus TaxID=300112 RepID=A0A4S2KFS4_9HYME|nr:hypothetical protein DBV15_12020 [Temnothorax longispinosus]
MTSFDQQFHCPTEKSVVDFIDPFHALMHLQYEKVKFILAVENNTNQNNRCGLIKLIYGSSPCSCIRSPSRIRSIRQANKTLGTLLTKGLLTLNPIMNVISGNNMESTLVSVRPRPVNVDIHHKSTHTVSERDEENTHPAQGVAARSQKRRAFIFCRLVMFRSNSDDTTEWQWEAIANRPTPRCLPSKNKNEA